MAWNLLPTNHKDASWVGLKRYNKITNEDGTVSFQDVTAYTDKDLSFFGAKEANRMNEALNTIMSMVENGTDLYTAFQNYFTEQKGLFKQTADNTQSELTSHVGNLRAEGDSLIETIKNDYRDEMDNFEDNQERVFNTWFSYIKGKLGTDPAGDLQNQVNDLDTKTDGFEPREVVFAENGNITETFGNKRIETEFVSDAVIIQKLYVNDALYLTKTVTFDGTSIKEDIR